MTSGSTCDDLGPGWDPKSPKSLWCVHRFAFTHVICSYSIEKASKRPYHTVVISLLRTGTGVFAVDRESRSSGNKLKTVWAR